MNHDGSNVASLYGNGCLLLYWHKTPVFGAVESSSRRRDNFKVFFAHLSCIKAGGSIWKKTYEEHDKIVLYSIRSYIIIALANILSMWNYMCFTDWLIVCSCMILVMSQWCKWLLNFFLISWLSFWISAFNDCPHVSRGWDRITVIAGRKLK